MPWVGICPRAASLLRWAQPRASATLLRRPSHRRSLASYKGRGKRARHAPTSHGAATPSPPPADKPSATDQDTAPTAPGMYGTDDDDHVASANLTTQANLAIDEAAAGAAQRRPTIWLQADDWITRLHDVGDWLGSRRHMESMPQSHTLRVVRGPAEAASAEAAATPAELFRTTETRSELEGVNVRRGAGVDETEESLRFSEGMILERATDGLDGRPRALLRNTNGDHVEPEQGGVMWARLRGAEGWVFVEDCEAIDAASWDAAWGTMCLYRVPEQDASLIPELECFIHTKVEALTDHLAAHWPGRLPDGSPPEVRFVHCREHHDPPEADVPIEPWDRLDELFITSSSPPLSEGPQNRPVIAALVGGEKHHLNAGQPLVLYEQRAHPLLFSHAAKSMFNPFSWGS